MLLVLDNLRSLYNVGSILRSADGFGVKKVICCGTTPHPEITNDQRLPHIIKKADAAIAKTALGAEKTIEIVYFKETSAALAKLKNDNYQLIALEQTRSSQPIDQIKPKALSALILGPEVEGLSEDVMNFCDFVAEIPMQGQKESFNVSVACGIALYALLH